MLRTLTAVLLSSALTVAAAQTALPFVQEAINYGRTGTVAKGVTAAVYATVTLASSTPAPTADRSMVGYGSGRLEVQGTGAQQRLVGEFPVLVNSGSPFQNTAMTLNVSLAADGQALVGVKIAGKNFLGRAPSAVQFRAVGNLLVASGVNVGGYSNMTLALNRGVWPAPNTVSTPPVEAPKKPSGVRVKVGATFVVTNADDGVADNTVELAGGIQIGVNGVIRFAGTSASKGAQFAANTIVVDIPYNVPDARFLAVGGTVGDLDSASGNDILWRRHELVDLLGTVQARPVGMSTLTLAGDRNDENGELYLTVEKVEDLY